MNAIKQTEGGRLSLAAASKFAERWKDVTSEKQFDQQFWHEFFKDICGIEDFRESGIEFQKKVISSKRGTQNYIDVFWKDVFLVEHKSAGKDLDAAEAQARDYLVSLPPALRPPSLIISDFARFRIVDVLLGNKVEFPLEELPLNLNRIEALIEMNSKKAVEVQIEADQKAAQLMADLYIELKNYQYEGHVASVFMVRILFCLFADDTRMWKTSSFSNLVKDTNPLGTDLGPRLATLFEILDTPKELRKGPQDPLLEDFPYVNGGIFSERLETINFNAAMRNALMNACMYDWSSINPTIFGALFQDIKSRDERHANGEHYTTEQNIEKTIGPLFLDELYARLESVWDHDSKLKSLQIELGKFQILDPACGCGNFLITTYKRLRQLELDIIVRIKQLDGTFGQTSLLDVSEDLHVKMEQFHGIEYVEWSSQIAKVAMHLTDHQENLKLETILGVAANRFPLTHASKIVQGNALQIDWAEICPMTDKTIIVGNPPFLGASWQNEEQKKDQTSIWSGVKRSGGLDYVSNWYLLASRYIQKTTGRVAFVSTNSITQGEQPAVIWGELSKLGVGIDFAHRTFVWQSDAAGKAAVHCVIIGFSKNPKPKKRDLYSYSNGKGLPILEKVLNINAYLLDAPEVLIKSRTKPLMPSTPIMNKGSQPTDDGYLSNISIEEAETIRETDPIASKYLKPLMGGQEFIQGRSRYCLWLVNAKPEDLTRSPELSRRIAAVREMRLSSSKASTRKDAERPYLFQENRQPQQNFIAVPEVSSENRDYIPVGFFTPDVIPTNKIQVIEGGGLSLFSLLTSRVFSAWVKGVSGRLGSSISISSEITYNNFPFPALESEQRKDLERTAQDILDVRKTYFESSLATLHNPLATPHELLKAYQANDKAVLRIFGLGPNATESEILSTLLARHSHLIDGE